MNIAILLFEGFTALDAVGPYETLGRIPGATLTFVAEEAGPVRTDTGNLALTADATIADAPDPDILVIPGGPGRAGGPRRRPPPPAAAAAPRRGRRRRGR